MSVLIWTRARADWIEDAPKIDAAMHLPGLSPSLEIVRIPCLELTPLAFSLPKQKLFHAAILTSAKALDFATPELRDALSNCQRIYTHGEKTASTALAMGLRHIERIDVRTAEDLATHLIAKFPHGTSVLIPTAADPAFDMGPALAAAGLKPTIVKTYQTSTRASLADGSALTPEDIARAQTNWSGVVCFASPSAVTGFSAAFMQQVSRLRSSLTAIALGPTTAAACTGKFQSIRPATSNRLEAMIQCAFEELRSQAIS